jgi:WhiB family redox-sensing transcriptional regulator
MTEGLRGEWPTRAECVTDPELMFPEDKDARGIAVAKAICAECIVVEPCLTNALETNEPFGIRGGLTPDERRRLTRR